MGGYGMTREEEIRQASIEYTIGNRPMCIGGGAFSKMADELNRNKSFEEGAKWADKTMIEKACGWLTKHLYDYDRVEGYEVFRDVKSFVNDFRKAMEE